MKISWSPMTSRLVREPTELTMAHEELAEKEPKFLVSLRRKRKQRRHPLQEGEKAAVPRANLKNL